MQTRLTEIAESIISYRPRWLTYDDGGGAFRCMVLDERPRGSSHLAPGGTMLLIEAAAGSRFGVHNHFCERGEACTEVFTVVEGQFEVTGADGKALLLVPGNTLSVPPGEDHSVHAVTACAVWAASIPTARGYGYVPSDFDGQAAGVRGGDGARDGGIEEGPDRCSGSGPGMSCCAA